MSIAMPAARSEAAAAPRRSVRPPGRLTLLLAVIVVTSLSAAALSLAAYLRPIGEGDDTLPTYADLAAHRQYVWAFFLIAGVQLVLGVGALAIAGWILTPLRGSTCGTVGGALLCVGATVYAMGVAGWAAVWYFASDTTTLDVPTASALIDHVNDDTARMLVVPIGGAAVVGVGGLVLAVGLWRARTVPRWLVVAASVITVVTFATPPDQAVGLVMESLSAASGILIGVYAWRFGAARAAAEG
jgi:hypothetical protein